MTDATFAYALDARQQAMLEAMGVSGVPLWMKAANHEPVTTNADAGFDAKTPKAAENITKFATNNIANNASRREQAPSPAPISPTTSPTPSPAIEPAPVAVQSIHRTDAVHTMSWPDVIGAVRSCQSCTLCATRTKTVFGSGQPGPSELEPPQVDWLIVGEAPGEQEDLAGEPFVGPAGQLLDNMLAAMRAGKRPGFEGQGLSRAHNVFITNVLKCRPPANRNPAADELALCQPFLARQIELLRPKIIIAMGKFAIASLTGSQEPVGKLRGRVHALAHERGYQAPVIVTYHPAYLLRNLPAKALAWQDLLLAMRSYNALMPL